jgi:hypothetical protein
MGFAIAFFVTCNDPLITSEVHDFLKANLADYKHQNTFYLR